MILLQEILKIQLDFLKFYRNVFPVGEKYFRQVLVILYEIKIFIGF